MAAPIVPTILFGGFFAWGIYRRIRRNIGQQKLRPVRIIISLAIFSIVSLVLLFLSLSVPKLMLGIGGGLLAGAGLGFIGLKLTTFETTEAGHFYTPNTQIGIALSILFIGRMLYRFWVLSDTVNAHKQPLPFQSALTYLIFGLIAGYYLIYYIGLFVHTHDKPIPGK